MYLQIFWAFLIANLFSYAISTTQTSNKIPGSWELSSYKIDGNLIKISWITILVFKEGGAYENLCSYGQPELEKCETGAWNLLPDNVIYIKRDNPKWGGLLHPRSLKISHITSDSLIIVGKEGSKEIISYYLKQK